MYAIRSYYAQFEGDLYQIAVYGADKPGIVYRVAKALGDRQVNILDLHTKLIGTETRPVYVMILEAVLPAGLEETELKEVMHRLKGEMHVDISVRSITPVEL